MAVEAARPSHARILMIIYVSRITLAILFSSLEYQIIMVNIHACTYKRINTYMYNRTLNK